MPRRAVQSPDTRRKRAAVASAAANVARRGTAEDHAAYTKARTDYAAAALEDYIDKVLAAAPPIPDDRLDRIAARLRASRTRAGADAA